MFGYPDDAFASDTATDFEDGSDRIDLSDSRVGFGDLTAEATGAGTVLGHPVGSQRQSVELGAQARTAKDHVESRACYSG